MFAVPDLSLMVLGDLIDHVPQMRANEPFEVFAGIFECRHRFLTPNIEAEGPVPASVGPLERMVSAHSAQR